MSYLYLVHECAGVLSIVLQGVPLSLDEDEFSVHECAGVLYIYCTAGCNPEPG